MVSVAIAVLISANIYGAVVDINDGSPIVGANIILLADTGNFKASAVSDVDGSFEITSIPNGEYTLRVTHISHKPYEKHLSVKGDRVEVIVRMEKGVITLPPLDVQASRATDEDGVPFTEICERIGDQLLDARTGRGHFLLYNVGPLERSGKFDVIAIAATPAEADRLLTGVLPELLGV